MPRIGTSKQIYKTKSKERIPAIPNIYNGISFKSKQETAAYKELVKFFPDIKYEPESFTLLPELHNKKIVHTKIGNSAKRNLKEVKIVEDQCYTPDFIIYQGKYKWIIEVKGYANETWPNIKKLFIHHIQDKPEILGFFECSSIKQVQQVIEIIKNHKQCS